MNITPEDVKIAKEYATLTKTLWSIAGGGVGSIVTVAWWVFRQGRRHEKTEEHVVRLWEADAKRLEESKSLGERISTETKAVADKVDADVGKLGERIDKGMEKLGDRIDTETNLLSDNMHRLDTTVAVLTVLTERIEKAMGRMGEKGGA